MSGPAPVFADLRSKSRLKLVRHCVARSVRTTRLPGRNWFAFGVVDQVDQGVQAGVPAIAGVGVQVGAGRREGVRSRRAMHAEIRSGRASVSLGRQPGPGQDQPRARRRDRDPPPAPGHGALLWVSAVASVPHAHPCRCGRFRAMGHGYPASCRGPRPIRRPAGPGPCGARTLRGVRRSGDWGRRRSGSAAPAAAAPTAGARTRPGPRPTAAWTSPSSTNTCRCSSSGGTVAKILPRTRNEDMSKCGSSVDPGSDSAKARAESRSPTRPG